MNCWEFEMCWCCKMSVVVVMKCTWVVVAWLVWRRVALAPFASPFFLASARFWLASRPSA